MRKRAIGVIAGLFTLGLAFAASSAYAAGTGARAA